MTRSSVLPMIACMAGMMVASVWPSYGLPGSATTWATNWPPRECRRGVGHAHLHTELVGLVCLSLADAFHLGCMQAVNLAAALVAVLRQHTLGQVQRPHER